MIAPDSNRSATARSITTRRPLWVEEIDFGDGTVGYATDGTPVDCVRFAVARADRRLHGRPDRLGHQPRLEPRRRHHLLGHGGGRVRGRHPRHPGHRGLPAVDRARDGLPPRPPLRLRRRRRVHRAAGGGDRRRAAAAGHAAQRQRARPARSRASRSRSSASGSTATSSRSSTRSPAATSTASTATRRTTTTRTAPTSPRSPTAASRSRRCTSTSPTAPGSRRCRPTTSRGCSRRRRRSWSETTTGSTDAQQAKERPRS